MTRTIGGGFTLLGLNELYSTTNVVSITDINYACLPQSDSHFNSYLKALRSLQMEDMTRIPLSHLKLEELKINESCLF